MVPDQHLSKMSLPCFFKVSYQLTLMILMILMILKNRGRPKSVKYFSVILHGFLKFLFLRSSKKEKPFYNESPFLGLHLVESNGASTSLIRISAASLIPDAYDNYKDKFSMAAGFFLILLKLSR